LSLPIYSDPALSEEVEALAREVAGKSASAEMQALGRRVAEAQVDLRRVRAARHRLLSQALSEPFYDSRANALQKLAVLARNLGRNAREVMPMAALVEYVTTTPKGPQKLALILSQEIQKLSAMDRYERRALSRRKSAIRAFDLAKRNCSE
jgi:hypothetical protein